MNEFFAQLTSFANAYYIAFLVIVVILFYFFRKSTVFLLLASIFFYATFSIKYCILFVLLSLVNYLFGLILGKFRKKILLVFAITINLSILAIFRYSNFILQNLGGLNLLGFSDFSISIFQPLGISFFTFEYLHYLIDVYRGKKSIKNLVNFILFPFFFPTQIAGPIKRYETFIPQLKNNKLDWEKIQTGSLLIIRGFFKKLVLANNLAPFVSAGFDTRANSWISILAIYSFAFQIFFDFSGYTDIGRGSAFLLGFDIPENFLQPYLSSDIREFWRRWHITLMKWLTDYIYIPLGGNRVNSLRFVINILVVFLLSGLWHGAAWHFVLWGLYNGILVLLSNKFHLLSNIRNANLKKILSVFFTFHFVLLGWIIFRAKNALSALFMLKEILHFNFYAVQLNEPILYILFLFSLYLFYKLALVNLFKHYRNWAYIRYASYGIAIIIMILQQTNPVQFIYFQF